MKGENRMTKDELIKKMYDIRKEGFELTRKSLSKIDANIYTNAEDIFGSWVAAKKEFYEYERQLKKKERAERAAKNKNKSNRKSKTEKVEKSDEDNVLESANETNNEIVAQDTLLEPTTETTSTQTELPVNDTVSNNISDTDVYSELEKSIFKNIDNALTETDKESISNGIVPHNVIQLLSGFKEDFISKYIKYFMANNSLSKDAILNIVKENISVQDISLNDSAKAKFEHINKNILEKFNSIEHAIVELIKK